MKRAIQDYTLIGIVSFVTQIKTQLTNEIERPETELKAGQIAAED